MQIVIIGAGVSGLSAAMRLSQNAGYSIVILEATDRIGGRIKPEGPIGGKIVDLGASWMHETRHNILFQTALREKWPMKYTDSNMKSFTQHGEIRPEEGIEPIRQDIDHRIAEKIHDSLDPLGNEPSLEDFIDAELGSMPLITKRQAQLAKLLTREYEHFVGLPLSKTPANDGGVHNLLGRDAFVLGSGYQVVVDWLKSQINWDNVVLCTESPVEAVIKSSESKSGKYTVLTTEMAEHFADYVICTIPLGALKTSFNSIFSTLLVSDTHLSAVRKTIEQSDVASLGKIVIEFAEPFWDTTVDSFFVSHDSTGESFSIINPFQNNVLVFLTGPPFTEQIEREPQTAFDRIAWTLLAIQLPGKRVSDARKVLVTNWTQSPYFRGSYSARALGQSFDELVAGYVHNDGAIRFAGEHTIIEGNGCVHGAHNSGLREAEYIIENKH